MTTKRASVSIALVLGMAWAAVAGPSLLVQTSVPWNATDPGAVMTSLGIAYDQIPHSSFAAQSLAGYDFILLQGSDGEDEYYDDYIVPAPSMTKVSDYVNDGGLAIIHYADYVGGDYTIAPSSVKRTWYTDDQGNITTGFETDPLFNNVTDASLDGWGNTSHGYLTDLPTGTDVLITDSIGRPIYARYGLGAGQVWVTTMTLEWPGADPDVLINELSLADQFIPIPAPGAVLLAGIGVGLVGWLRKRKINLPKRQFNISG